MTRALTVAVAALAAAGIAGGAAGSTERAATLRLAKTTPLTVAGSRFLAYESVVVRARADDERWARRVRATRAGRFTVALNGVEMPDRCNSDFRVWAIGNGGSRGELKGPQLQCPPRLGRP